VVLVQEHGTSNGPAAVALAAMKDMVAQQVNIIFLNCMTFSHKIVTKYDIITAI
jgi:hypothetical protein